MNLSTRKRFVSANWWRKEKVGIKGLSYLKGSSLYQRRKIPISRHTILCSCLCHMWTRMLRPYYRLLKKSPRYWPQKPIPVFKRTKFPLRLHGRKPTNVFIQYRRKWGQLLDWTGMREQKRRGCPFWTDGNERKPRTTTWLIEKQSVQVSISYKLWQHTNNTKAGIPKTGSCLYLLSQSNLKNEIQTYQRTPSSVQS